MSEEIKPCPFCGSEAVIGAWYEYGEPFIECSNPRCGAHIELYSSDLNIRAWNRRVDP